MWFFPLRVQGQHCKVNNIIVRFNLHKTKHNDNSTVISGWLPAGNALIFPQAVVGAGYRKKLFFPLQQK